MKKRMDEMDRQIQLLSEERGYRVIVLALALWVLYNCWQTFFRGEAYAPLPAQILCLGVSVQSFSQVARRWWKGMRNTRPQTGWPGPSF